MQAFVTVGSTRFDALVDATISPLVLEALKAKGYSKLVVQCGGYTSNLGDANADNVWILKKNDFDIEVWRYKSSLSEAYQNASLIISHAGSGTILDVLRLGKPLIVVPNTSLADNHQEELADELDKLGYLRAATVLNLPHCIQALRISELREFPAKDTKIFSSFLDDIMGFETPNPVTLKERSI